MEIQDLASQYGIGGVDELLAKYYNNPAVQVAGPVESIPPANTAPVASRVAPVQAEGIEGVVPAQPSSVPPQLMDMLSKYTSGESTYGPELKAARGRANAETEAFQKMIQSTIEGSPADKAEMYFRLAAAFGAPTKTGGFAETIGKVGETMSEYTKGQGALKKQLQLEGQKMKMQGAKEDLTTLRTLAGEEMKDKRAISAELLKDYIKSGQPQSTAGKQAQDEGLKPGSPEFQKRVAQIADANVEKQMATINATLANMSVAQSNLLLNQQKFDESKKQAAKLSPTEVKLKTDTEDMLAQTEQGMANLKKAYKLNPNTFDNSLPDLAQRKVLEAAGSKDPKVINTRELENTLEKAALSSLKSTFPGAISNDERKALQDVQGLGAKSIEERGRIMKSGYAALKAVSERSRKRLNEINSGLYRDTSPAAAEDLDEGKK
jgi:hypothetical protein